MEHPDIKAFDLDAKIHPDLKERFSKLPVPPEPLTKENFIVKRQMFAGFISSFLKLSHDDVTSTDQTIPGPKDAPDVTIVVHQPKERTGKLPGLLWMHGGGFYAGNTDLVHNLGVKFAHGVGCIFIAIRYRLAPENPYPAALNDCYAVLSWMSNNADELGIDADRIAIGGQSAGGGLCAALALYARDQNGPKICAQFPLYPMIDDRSITVSSHQIYDLRGWNRKNNLAAWEMYLGDEAKKETPIYAAPSRAKDLSNLPPTYTFVGELELFRDEITEYAKRLGEAGVPVEFHLYPGCVHGFEVLVSEANISKRASEELLTVIKFHLKK